MPPVAKAASLLFYYDAVSIRSPKSKDFPLLLDQRPKARVRGECGQGNEGSTIRK